VTVLGKAFPWPSRIDFRRLDHIAQWLDRIVARLTEAGLLVQRLLIAAVAVVFFLPGQASLPVTDRDEARFTQASLQMVESGDPVDIRFQDEPRLKKPVGIYWLQAGAMLLSGQGAEASVFVQRLPSLLGAVVAVVLVHVADVPLIGAAGGVAVPFLAFGPAPCWWASQQRPSPAMQPWRPGLRCLHFPALLCWRWLPLARFAWRCRGRCPWRLRFWAGLRHPP
jgi:hypothetical protein